MSPDTPLPRVGLTALLQGLLLTSIGWFLLGASLWTLLRAMLEEPLAWRWDAWGRYTAFPALAYVAGFIILFYDVSFFWKLAHDPFGFDVLLWAAGMAGTIPVVRLWEKFPSRTYINLGSAMDPLTRSATEPKGYTRSGQLSHARAKEFFRELL